MSETQGSVGAWSDRCFPPLNGRDAGVRAQAIKLLQEAVELAMAAGASANDCYLAANRTTEKILRETGQSYTQGRPIDYEAVRKESADCNVVNNVIAHRAGFDLALATDEVMTGNRMRQWSVSADGSAQHVPPGAA